MGPWAQVKNLSVGTWGIDSAVISFSIGLSLEKEEEELTWFCRRKHRTLFEKDRSLHECRAANTKVLTNRLRMDLFNSALGKNITFVHPEYFIIGGFLGIPHVRYYYVFLFFIYIVSLFGNTAVMIIIILDHNLRTPKYMAILNLVLVDLFSNSALVPKFIEIFLFNNQSIPYNDCLAFLFFCFTALSMQAFSLVALSYDRMMAIIFPLHYQVKVTHRFMLCLIAFLWLIAITLTLTAVGLLTRISFCESVVINSYFCDHGPMYRLGCNDVTPSRAFAALASNIIIWFPLLFILGSYCGIFYALFKISTARERVKAFKTCTGHLSLVAIYFVPIMIVYPIGETIDPNERIINLSLNYVIPPTLNPIIYVLQTQEIKETIKKMLKKKVQSKITTQILTRI